MRGLNPPDISLDVDPHSSALHDSLCMNELCGITTNHISDSDAQEQPIHSGHQPDGSDHETVCVNDSNYSHMFKRAGEHEPVCVNDSYSHMFKHGTQRSHVSQASASYPKSQDSKVLEGTFPLTPPRMGQVRDSNPGTGQVTHSNPGTGPDSTSHLLCTLYDTSRRVTNPGSAPHTFQLDQPSPGIGSSTPGEPYITAGAESMHHGGSSTSPLEPTSPRPPLACSHPGSLSVNIDKRDSGINNRPHASDETRDSHRADSDAIPTTIGPAMSPASSDWFTPQLDPAVVAEHSRRVEAFWPHTTQAANVQFPEFCKLYQRVKSFNLPNALGARITVPSGLHLDRWEDRLRHYHDREICAFLDTGGL